MIPATASPLRSCRLLGAAALVLLMVSAFTPAVNFLDAWIAVPSVIAPAAAIVVLGAGGGTLDDGLPDALSLRRALRGILLYRAGLAPVLVFSGSAVEIEGRAEMAQRLEADGYTDHAHLLRGEAFLRDHQFALAVGELQQIHDQGDLLVEASAIYGLAFHPDFEKNRKCYVCYTLKAKKPGQHNLKDGTRVRIEKGAIGYCYEINGTLRLGFNRDMKPPAVPAFGEPRFDYRVPLEARLVPFLSVSVD